MSINVNDKNLGHATAYAYYKAGGGTMTEAEFTEFMADFGTASQTAVEAAQEALASKNAAQTAATTATNKASEATTAATTATNKAAEAQADADAAALDASQALSAASTATTKATEATTAAATATSAKTDAVAANTAAQSAKTAAQTAQTGAETAAASVSASAAQIATNAEDIDQLKSDLNDVNAELADVRVGADGTTYASAGAAVRGQINSVLSVFDGYVAKNGENQVTPQNIEGVTFDKEEGTVIGDDFFTEDFLFEENYYVSVNTNVTPNIIAHATTSGYRVYCIPVDGVSKYTFTGARFGALAKGNTIGSEAVGTTLAYPNQVDSTGASYLFLTYTESTTSIEIHKVTEGYVYSNFVMPDWTGIPTLQSDLSKTDDRVYELQYLNGVNLFDHAELIKHDGYASISNGKIYLSNLEDYNAYLLPVDGKSIYTFTSCRFAFLVDSDKETAIGDLLRNITQVDSTGASYICFSFNYSTFPVANYKVVGKISANTTKTKFAYVSGNIASGGNMQLTAAKTNLRKGERIVFEGDITSFDSLTIGLTYGTNLAESTLKNYFVINATNINYYATNSSTPVEVAHGLTLSDNIQIIWEMSAVASCKITLISDGNLFVHEFINFSRQAIGNPFVISTGTVLTDCKLTWTCIDIDKQIWMFGDSYFQYSENRWTYYLHQYGYDQNCLLDGFAGEGGTNGRVAFNNLLQFGTPKFAVWCLGMNDTTDSESAPATDWVTSRDYFLQYCQNNNVTPIFGTIPTVPTINHEQKNAWIRSSGYRYIDFAKAVGANANGVWYSGMLSSDGVHPTAQGARALFSRVLLDLPEIMIGGYGTPTAINS